ncbi:hypothetical protein PU629_05190 [Pullulanibacillus sp. KACC 23026]|uniref:hypothetical protein n=1 Tax=Pullulanibacillus sp. KACC 23026 TaxID=3028315 RepID=UPI0023B1DB4C|nr:hypothetical protein [Pullulanibacillus sp. KACC 23026]WEG13763.1 hypothetical protein PU629_05190 [Pullulanibacillus sp. KACC 23026]
MAIRLISYSVADSVFSLRSTQIGVTSVPYFGIPSHFEADSVVSLRSIEIGVTSIRYFGIPARLATG